MPKQRAGVCFNLILRNHRLGGVFLLELLKDVEHQYFETSDGVRLHYIAVGEGEPLIMVPGGLCAHDYFAYQIPVLSQHYRLYILDPRGFGLSDIPSHGYRIPRLATDMKEWLVHLQIEKAYFLGHSMGCSVIWSYMDLYGQESIKKFILVDQPPTLVVNPIWNEEERRDSGATAVDIWGFSNEFVVNAEKPMAAFSKYLPLGVADREQKLAQNFKDYLSQSLPVRDWKVASTLMLNHVTQDWRDVVKRIHVKTLCMTGDLSSVKDGVLWNHRQIPNSELVVFSREELGGHNLLLENPEKANQVILEFLQA